MKKLIFAVLSFFVLFTINATAQERFGKTLNVGIGIGGYSGYYGYADQSLPVFHLNYEFDVAKSFTVAPFITFYSYKHNAYRETVIPIGAKGSFYFDQLLKANQDWDFYLAGSLGFAIVKSSWDDDYYGNKDDYNKAPSMFFDVHAGVEYHLSKSIGLFLDFSGGVSTVGLAFH